MCPFPVFGPSPLSVPFWAGDGPWAMELGTLGVGRAQSHLMGPLPGLPGHHGAWCFTPSVRTGTAPLALPRLALPRTCTFHPASPDPPGSALLPACATSTHQATPGGLPEILCASPRAHPVLGVARVPFLSPLPFFLLLHSLPTPWVRGQAVWGWRGGLGCAAMSTPTQTQAHRALLVSWPKGSPAVPRPWSRSFEAVLPAPGMNALGWWGRVETPFLWGRGLTAEVPQVKVTYG